MGIQELVKPNSSTDKLIELQTHWATNSANYKLIEQTNLSNYELVELGSGVMAGQPCIGG